MNENSHRGGAELAEGHNVVRWFDGSVVLLGKKIGGSSPSRTVATAGAGVGARNARTAERFPFAACPRVSMVQMECSV